MKCSACAKDLEPKEGIESFGSRFCLKCFYGRAQEIDRKLTPEELEYLRQIGREHAGILPPDLIEMIVVGHCRRGTGITPPKEETERCVGEMQKLAALVHLTQELNLLKKWHEIFSEFVRDQEQDIREKMKRLTDGI